MVYILQTVKTFQGQDTVSILVNDKTATSIYTEIDVILRIYRSILNTGGVAQMVERSLSMREVPGSIPGASNPLFS